MSLELTTWLQITERETKSRNDLTGRYSSVQGKAIAWFFLFGYSCASGAQVVRHVLGVHQRMEHSG